MRQIHSPVLLHEQLVRITGSFNMVIIRTTEDSRLGAYKRMLNKSNTKDTYSFTLRLANDSMDSHRLR